MIKNLLNRLARPDLQNDGERSYRYIRLETDMALLLGDRKDAVEALQQNIWQYVAISKAQYDAHYTSLVKQVAVYAQDPEVVYRGISNAREALAGTMINRLPTDRPREETHLVEQLWKFAMFACYLLDELQRIERCFYDADNKILDKLNSRAVQWSADGPLKKKWMLSNSMSTFFPAVSLDWLTQDEGRAMAEIMKCINGEPCFIHGETQAGNRPRHRQPKAGKGKQGNDNHIAKKRSDLSTPAGETTVKRRIDQPTENAGGRDASSTDRSQAQAIDKASTIRHIDTAEIFDWGEGLGYVEENKVFIPGLSGCKALMAHLAWQGSIRELQDAIFEHGADNCMKNIDGERISGYTLSR